MFWPPAAIAANRFPLGVRVGVGGTLPSVNSQVRYTKKIGVSMQSVTDTLNDVLQPAER